MIVELDKLGCDWFRTDDAGEFAGEFTIKCKNCGRMLYLDKHQYETMTLTFSYDIEAIHCADLLMRNIC